MSKLSHRGLFRSSCHLLRPPFWSENCRPYSAISFVQDYNDTGKDALSSREWDAVVVGGGHNGLTAAAYLAAAGRQVAVLERRHVIGGAAVTEEIIPGFKFSRASYLQSLLRPAIIKELDLARYGLELLPRCPASFTPTSDGRALLLGLDAAETQAQISKFSSRDAEAFPRYQAQLERFVVLVNPLLDIVPPQGAPAGWLRSQTVGTLRARLQEAASLTAVASKALAMGATDIKAFAELLLAPAAKVLDKWFESDVLKATLATDAVIGAMASPYEAGTGYVLLHHVMGESDGRRGVWS